MKTKYWIMLLTGILAVCVILSLNLMNTENAVYAQIYSEGKLYHILDLRVEQTLTVESNYGINVITVKDGRIAVTDADCPDGYCMDRGYCSGGMQIICLPNRMEIRFVGAKKVDGVVG